MQLLAKQTGSISPYVPGEILPELAFMSVGGAKALLDIGANAGLAIREGRLPVEWLNRVAEAVISNDAAEWGRLSKEWEESDPVSNAIQYFNRVASMSIVEEPKGA